MGVPGAEGERKTWLPQEKRGYRQEGGPGTRGKAVDYARFEVLEGGRTWREAARDLGTGERTLRRWRALESGEGVSVSRAGRPRKRLGGAGRREVLRLLVTTGPSLGVSPLRRRFQDLSRAEAREILEKYREHYRRRHPRVIHELRWLVPEAVWSMDFTELAGREVLAVRELARGRKVLWAEPADLGAEELVRVIEPVFALTRPLVLKTDRGAAFRAAVFEDFLRARGVTILFSPPSRPEYNGSIESEIRWLKPLVRDVRERLGGGSGESLRWAQALANELRVKAEGEVQPPSEELRAAFQETVGRDRGLAEEEAHYGGEVPARVRATLERLAIERALVAHGILEVRRRVIPLPKRFLFAA